MLTTTIGAYPKPAGVAIGTWFDDHARQPGANPDAAPTVTGDADESALDHAVHEVVREQVALGIDIPTDGEVRRENYVHYHCRRLNGIDFARLTEKAARGGAWSTSLPTIVGRISPKDHFLPREWRVAQDAADRPVKVTVPGPLTIADTVADDHYGDPAALGRALAEALNFELVALAAAGCRHIQVDEPVFARDPDAAAAFGVEHLERCFYNVPPAVTRAVHVCCGYPERLDQSDYLKAPPENYFRLAEALDAAAIDAVSIEDAHRHNDLRLLERFARSAVVLGVVAIATSRVETVDEIGARLHAALGHIDAARLIAAPDCGLAMLPRETARHKLANLCAAARGLA